MQHVERDLVLTIDALLVRDEPITDETSDRVEERGKRFSVGRRRGRAAHDVQLCVRCPHEFVMQSIWRASSGVATSRWSSVASRTTRSTSCRFVACCLYA